MKVKKIKATLLVFIGLVVLSFSVFAMAQENSSSNKNIFQDSDQDGLANEEEKAYGTDPFNPDTDGDGYSDWIEIQSGYDPLKPAPGDKIVNQNETQQEVAGTSTENSEKNLTQELSTKTTALISQSQIENKDIQIEDLDNVIDETIGKELTFNDLPGIDIKTIKVKKQNYAALSEKNRVEKEKEDATNYLTAIGYIVATNSPQSVETADDIQKLLSEFLDNMNTFSNDTNSIPKYFTDLSELKTSRYWNQWLIFTLRDCNWQLMRFHFKKRLKIK
jgi:predicted nucleotidyltransferase